MRLVSRLECAMESVLKRLYVDRRDSFQLYDTSKSALLETTKFRVEETHIFGGGRRGTTGEANRTAMDALGAA